MVSAIVNYRAIKWDNYQGGCGMPYSGQLIISFQDDTTATDIIEIATSSVAELEADVFTGEAKVSSIVFTDFK